jgi:cell division protein FtsB
MSIKNQYKHKIITLINKLNDARFIGQLVFVVIVLLISWSGVKVIQTNYGLQKQIETLKQQNKVQELKNKNLALQNQYYQSNQYLELSARQNFNLAAPGEKEIIVPPSVAWLYTVNLPSTVGISFPSKSKQPTYQKNFESWVSFFLHRSNN